MRRWSGSRQCGRELRKPCCWAEGATDAGLRLHKDKLDGYSFLFPEEWIPVTSTGADVFYRDIDDVETNVFVEFSSPSSSSYSSLKDIGTPMQAAKRAEQQYLVEYMSTRIGVRRTTEVRAVNTPRGWPIPSALWDV
jgi:hypothetical protein